MYIFIPVAFILYLYTVVHNFCFDIYNYGFFLYILHSFSFLSVTEQLKAVSLWFTSANFIRDKKTKPKQNPPHFELVTDNVGVFL